MSTYTDASLIITPNSKKAGKLYSLKGADLDVVRATTATYVGSDGLIKTALANEVRFDYTNGSCPSILVEPQRTNLLLRSEEFNVSPWGTLGTITITPNSTIAPNGNNTADLILGSNASSSISQIYSGSIGVVYTSSFFIKNNNSTQSQLLIRNASTVIEATLNWTGSVLSSITNTTGITTFQSYNNGWYRIMSTYTSVEAAQRPRILPTLSTNQSVYIWGAQLEVGSNATSYIPTVASAVTRNADVITKSNVFTENLITSNGGTLFLRLSKNDLLVRQSAQGIFLNQLINNTGYGLHIVNLVSSPGSGRLGVRKIDVNGNIAIYNTTESELKLLLKWNGSSLDIFQNGIKVVSNSSFLATNMQFLSFQALDVVKNINNCILFPTQLTDQECIALTTL